MARYALIEGGRVTGVSEWDGVTPWAPPASAQAIECPEDVGAGWSYDGADWLEPPAPAAEVRRVAKAEFQRLFTTPETVAFNLARRQVAALVPADYVGGDAQKQALVGLEVFLLRYDALDTIELTHPETAEGLALLVALGVVTELRADAILAGSAP